jgi:hypothetical protein
VITIQLKYACILETINDIFVFILYLALLKMLCISIITGIKKYFLFLWKLLRRQQRIIQLNIADTSTQYRYSETIVICIFYRRKTGQTINIIDQWKFSGRFNSVNSALVSFINRPSDESSRVRPSTVPIPYLRYTQNTNMKSS